MKAEHPHRSTTHQEMFFHIFFDSSEQAELAKTGRGYKGATVFCRKEDDNWYAAVAFCSAKDQFVRRVGRSQARRRYFLVMQHSEWPFEWLGSLGPDKPTYDVVKAVALYTPKNRQETTNVLKQTMPKEIKAKWLEALRSGEYKQGVGNLREKNGYCCLGVLQMALDGDVERSEFGKDNSLSYPSRGWVEAKGINWNHEQGNYDPVVEIDAYVKPVSWFNDAHECPKATFAQIADAIEQQIEGV